MALNRSKRLNPRGKSRRSLDRASWQRKMLKIYAESDECEWIGGCSETMGLANAHRLKKTKITIEEEYVHGRAKLCKDHHDLVEHSQDHSFMWNAITRIIRMNRPDVPIPLFELPAGRYVGTDKEIYAKY